MSEQEKDLAMQEELKNQETPKGKKGKKAKKEKAPKKPKGWIRWSGVITLLVIVGVLGGLIYFISSLALKSKIEEFASDAWGAKVEVRSLGFGFSPLGLKVDGLALTDTENPMENLIEIERIRMTINLYHLVHKRFVFEDVALNGLKLNQPRKTSGFVAKKPKEEKPKDEDSSGMLDFATKALPSTDELLERETLETTVLADKVNQDVQTAQKKWDEIQKNLPTDASLQKYQLELEQLFNSKISSLDDLKAKQKKFEELEKKWKQDQEAIKAAKNFLNTYSKNLKQDITALRKMPNQDLERLLKTYSLDADGLENISFLLFGSDIQEKMQLAREWYAKAQPLIDWIKEYQKEQKAKKALAEAKAPKPERFKGEWIKFSENDPQPKFMIKRISFDGELENSSFHAKVWDLNFHHKESKKAVRAALMLQPKTQAQAFIAEATISAIETDDVMTNAQVSWQDYAIADWDMLKSDAMAITMDKAKAQVGSDIVLTNLAKVDAKMQIDYQEVAFNLGEKSSGQMQRFLAPTLKGIDTFKVNFDLKGDLFAPQVGVASDLDSKLAKGFKQALDQEVIAFKKKLEAELQAKLQSALKPLEDEINKLGLDMNQLSSKETLLKGLEKQGNDKLKQEQQVLEQAAKNKAKEEAKKQQDKLKKEAEQKLKKLLPF